ncbi:MAG: tetratricopeptide repeat protein [Crocinitomicaceae bacterium]
MNLPQVIVFLNFFFFASVFGQNESSLDSSTVNYLIQECETELKKNPANAIKIARKAATISLENNDQNRLALSFKLLGTGYFYLGRTDSTKFYWLKSSQLLSATKDNNLADSYNNLGVIYLRLGDTDSSLFFHNKSLDLRAYLKDTIGVASSLLNLGALQKGRGEFEIALSHYFSALKLYEDLNNKEKQGDSYNNIGLLYLSLNENEKSLEYLSKALSIKKQFADDRSIAGTINNIAAVYQHMDDYENAEQNYLKAKETFIQYGDKRMLAGLESNLGIIYKEKLQYSKATSAYLNAIENFDQLNDIEGLATVYNNLGAVYYLQNNYPASNLAYQKAEKHALKLNSLPLLSKAYQGLFNANKKLSNYSLALDYNEKYVAVNDTLFSQTTAEKIAELSEKYESEKKARQINQLEKNQLITAQKIQQRESFIWILSISSLLILTLLFFLINRFKLKRKILEAQNDRITLSVKIKEKELELKNRELTSYATNSLQKGEFLQSIHDVLDELEFKSNQTLLKVEDLKKKIKSKIDGVDDWDKFKLHFENVHPSFFEKLQLINQTLTLNDLRNCAYIKMKLSIKEVASLLNISPKSAKMNRYRLKKKLNLSADDDLNGFIQSL